MGPGFISNSAPWTQTSGYNLNEIWFDLPRSFVEPEPPVKPGPPPKPKIKAKKKKLHGAIHDHGYHLRFKRMI